MCPSAHELNISAQRILHSTVLAGGCNPWISPGQGGSQSVLDANGPSPACPVQVRLQLCSCSTDVRGSRPERQQQVGVQVLVGGLITHMLRGHQLLKLVTCNVWVCVCVCTAPSLSPDVMWYGCGMPVLLTDAVCLWAHATPSLV